MTITLKIKSALILSTIVFSTVASCEKTTAIDSPKQRAFQELHRELLESIARKRNISVEEVEENSKQYIEKLKSTKLNFVFKEYKTEPPPDVVLHTKFAKNYIEQFHISNDKESDSKDSVSVSIVGYRTEFQYFDQVSAWDSSIDLVFQGKRTDVLRLATRLKARFYDRALTLLEIRDREGNVVKLSPRVYEREPYPPHALINIRPAGFWIEELPDGDILLLQPMPVPLMEKPQLGKYKLRLLTEGFEDVNHTGGEFSRPSTLNINQPSSTFDLEYATLLPE